MSEKEMQKLKEEFFDFFCSVRNKDIERNDAFDQKDMDKKIDLPPAIEDEIKKIEKIDERKRQKTRLITRRLMDNLTYSAAFLCQNHVETAVDEFARFVDEDTDKYKPVFIAVASHLHFKFEIR